jgi:PAS domain S-box-containing protein
MDRREGTIARGGGAAAALRNRARANDLYHLVVDNLEDHCIILLAPDGSVASWNKGAERITGYDAGDVVGRDLAFIDRPEGAPQRKAALEEARAHGRWTHEGWWVREDGEHFCVGEFAAPLFEGEALTGFITIARDLTEERSDRKPHTDVARREFEVRADLDAADRGAAFIAEASSILVASSLSFEGAIRSLARLAASRLADWCLVYSLDQDGTIRLIDAAHRDPRKSDLLRDSLTDALEARKGHPISKVIQTGQSLRIDSITPALLNSIVLESQRAEFKREFPIASAMFTPLIARGRVLGALVFANAERKFDDPDLDMADELTRRAAIAIDNARLYRAAQDASRAKSDFLAVVSHELRTPLNAIMGYSDLLDAGISGPITSDQHRQLGKVRASARHLLQLIDEILSYARLESGNAELEIEEASMRDILDEAAAVMEPMARSKGIDLTLHVPEKDEYFWTDPPKARQILVNLLSNAVKFTQHGGVELSAAVENDQVRFDVRDTGIGMSQEQVDRIFDPFVQGERPTTRSVGGTGLGLSVARRFARLLGGEIGVQTHVGQGSTFTLRLPLYQHHSARNS